MTFSEVGYFGRSRTLRLFWPADFSRAPQRPLPGAYTLPPPLPTSLLLLLFSQRICRVWVGWRAKLDVAFFARWCRVSHHELQSFLVFN